MHYVRHFHAKYFQYPNRLGTCVLRATPVPCYLWSRCSCLWYYCLSYSLVNKGKTSYLWYILAFGAATPSLEVIKLFSCSTQLSMKFQTLITTQMLKITIFRALNPSDIVFIMLINVKILTFMSRINFVLS